MSSPPIPSDPRPNLPPAEQLASAKLALLHEPQEQAKPSGPSPMDAVTDAIREQPLIFAGLSALLGFFLFRKNFFMKKLVMLLGSRVAMTAIKRALSGK